MNFFEDIIPWFFNYWIIKIPLMTFFIYVLITELLDLIFNYKRIDRLLEHSDNFKIKPLIENYKLNKTKQLQLNKSNLLELKRQMDYLKIKEKKHSWRYSYDFSEKQIIITAKFLSDIFKIKK